MNYIFHLLILIGIYLLLIYSLNLIIGYGGLLSLCHGAFYGIGAYIYTIAIVELHLPFLISIATSIILTGFIAFLLGIPALRFRGNSFVLVTIGFQAIIFTILYNWVKITHGPYGISGIPRPTILGAKINTLFSYLILVIFTDLLFGTLLFTLYDSPFGLTLKALREDEKAAQALGKSAFRHFLKAFTLSGAFAAIPGALYASYITYIDPTSFTISESIFQVVILLLGGSGNKKGPFWGVVIMILFPEALRFLGLPDTIAANVREIIYGLTLILLMYYRPQGLAGEYKVK